MDDVSVHVVDPVTQAGTAPSGKPPVAGKPPVLTPWLRVQAVNVTRHAAALRPFRRVEFGTGDAAPSEGHIQAVNRLMESLRGGLLKMTSGVTDAAAAASKNPTSRQLQETVTRKEHAHRMVEAIERIWDFYF